MVNSFLIFYAICYTTFMINILVELILFFFVEVLGKLLLAIYKLFKQLVNSLRAFFVKN